MSSDDARVGDDLLYGARAIAAEMKWPVSRVYSVVEAKSGWPIWKETGAGLVSSKSALKAYVERRKQEALGRSAA